MGATGYVEYDSCDDENDESVWAPDSEEEETGDDESVCASDPEKEDTGKPSKPGQAKEEMPQVAAWLDEVKPSRMDKRRPSWLAEMKPRVAKVLHRDSNSRSHVSIYSNSFLLSARISRKGSFNVERLKKARGGKVRNRWERVQPSRLR